MNKLQTFFDYIDQLSVSNPPYIITMVIITILILLLVSKRKTKRCSKGGKHDWKKIPVEKIAGDYFIAGDEEQCTKCGNSK